MKIINEKLWDLINSIDYNRPGNRKRIGRKRGRINVF
nr:MAG TPA: hypothetical protein [Caudoviricetes sp.]